MRPGGVGKWDRDGVLGLMGCEEPTRRMSWCPIGCRIDLLRSINSI